jgi:hypothetical protein
MLRRSSFVVRRSGFEVRSVLRTTNTEQELPKLKP